jgi:uncharacterized protein YceK
MKRVFLTLATALLLAGCGGGSRHNGPTTQQTVTSTTTTAGTFSTTSTQQAPAKHNARKTLRAGVRAALAVNHKLAIKVLWTNRIPVTARQSTRGPALAELAASAKDREKKGVRVRMIRDDYRIISIGLDATKAHATAFAEWNQRVVPSHLNGTPRGPAVSLRERARIELRRVGNSQSFVVWKVTLIK